MTNRRIVVRAKPQDRLTPAQFSAEDVAVPRLAEGELGGCKFWPA